MSRLIFSLLLLLIADEASACNRCGLFGRNCRYYYPQRVVVQQAVPVIQQPDIFVIQNSYPGPIAQQGSTVYGFQQASSPYAVNPAELFRQAADFSRASIQTSQLAVSGYNQMANTQLSLQAQLSEPLIRSQAAVSVLNAAGLNCQQPTRQSSLSVRIYQDNGQWRIEQQDSSSPQSNSPVQADAQQTNSKGSPVQAPPSSSQPTTQSIIASKCYKCHSAQSTSLKGKLYLDREISPVILREAIIRLKSQDPKVRMPPDGSLTQGEAGEILNELLELSAPPAQPTQQSLQQ